MCTDPKMAVYHKPKLFLSSIVLVLILYLRVIDCCSGGSSDETTTKSPDPDGKYFGYLMGKLILIFFLSKYKMVIVCFENYFIRYKVWTPVYKITLPCFTRKNNSRAFNVFEVIEMQACKLNVILKY